MPIQSVSRTSFLRLSLLLPLLFGPILCTQSARCQTTTDEKLRSPFASFRLGIEAAPVASADVGLDVTFPRFHLGRSIVTRLDVDLVARLRSPSFGSRRDGEVYPMVSAVYTPGGVNRSRYFFGAGGGLAIGPHSGFAAKVFAGINFTPVVSLQLEERFPGDSTTRTLIMLRLAAL